LRWSEVVLLALGVHKQHIKSFVLLIPVVDDPAATSLAFSFQSPSELTKATGTGDYNPLFRAKEESKLQSTVLFVLKQVTNLSRKDWGLTKRMIQYTPMTYGCQEIITGGYSGANSSG
jgi:hypothetical protein